MDSAVDAATNSVSGGESNLPFWEAGSGHYGNTLGQMLRQKVSACTDLVLSFIDTIPVQKNGVFTIGDYGTNDGYSSMPLMSSIIEHLRKKYGEDLAIQIIYEDQEKNDFNSLFNRLSNGSSYLNRFSNVYTFATNISFYKRCVPDGTCDVILSTTATHWMENLDMNFKDAVFEVLATKEERERFCVEAERDWTKFLLLRAKELKQGGLLVVASPCDASYRQLVQGETTSTDSDMDAEAKTVYFKIYQNLDTAWKQLKEDKMITQEEYERCTAKLHLRSAEENKSPFERKDSAVRQAGLRLVHYDEYDTLCFFTAMWREHRKNTPNEDRAFFADRFTAAHRVWSQTTFHSSLSAERRETEKLTIMDELYRRVHSLVMSEHPESYRIDSYESRLVARKL